MKSNNLLLADVVIGRDGSALTEPLTLKLEAGNLLALRGRNGSGKSTCLKTLAGLLPPLSGEITWRGHALTEAPEYPAGILYLGHRRAINARLTVLDNIAAWARAYDQPELVEAALHFFDMEDIAQVTVGELSAGWQQRVALTRLITQPAYLWLLDEPSANLDEEGVQLLNALLQTRLERGGIVVLATHQKLEGERIAVLDLDMYAPRSSKVEAA